ncbi:MAG: PPOX class F420-dependent oxidoreductase [Candidatus Binataceae bacterium]
MAAPSLEQLAAERYVSLVTFRRNGNGVPTPIWVVGADGKLYAVTNGTSVKMKRLKANDKIRLAACDARGNVRGEWADGHGKRVEDPAVIDSATKALQQKYGWQMAIFRFFSDLSGRGKHRAFIEMTLS